MPPKVTAIEIALDAYSKGKATVDELAELVAHCYRSMTRPVSDNRRLYRDYKGSAQSLYVRPDSLVRYLKDGWQIGIGNTTDELYQHAYLKMTDSGEALPERKYRARLEVRLQQNKISGRSFKNWGSYAFQTLSKFFNFRIPKDDLDTFEQILLESMFQTGERGKITQVGAGRLYPKSTRADDALNRKAYDALRYLTNRWKGY